MTSGTIDKPITVNGANRFMIALLHTPVVRRFLGPDHHLTYTGQVPRVPDASGLPAHRRHRHVGVEVRVAARRNWWRNFVGDGAPGDAAHRRQRIAPAMRSPSSTVMR